MYKFVQRVREKAGRSLLSLNYAFRYVIIQQKNLVFCTFYTSCNAVSWVHSGLIPLCTDPFVKITLEGTQHLLVKPVVKKEPVTVDA